MVSTHWIFICPATHTHSTVELFIASPTNNKILLIELIHIKHPITVYLDWQYTLRMVSTHWIFICPATHTHSTVELFIASPTNNKMLLIELTILIVDFWPIKVNLPLRHTVAQLGKMCTGIPYMAGNQYSSLAWLLVTIQLIEREVSHKFSNTHWGGHLMSGNHP